MRPLPTESFSHFQLQEEHNASFSKCFGKVNLTDYKGSRFFRRTRNILEQNSQKHFQIINHEYAALAGCPDLAAVKQLELLGALIEVVSQRDAVFPFLDFAALCPELNIYWITCFQHLSQSRNMN